MFADRDGRIVTLKVGRAAPRTKPALILERLQQLDQGQLTLAAAREQIAAGISAAQRRTGRSGGASKELDSVLRVCGNSPPQVP